MSTAEPTPAHRLAAALEPASADCPQRPGEDDATWRARVKPGPDPTLRRRRAEALPVDADVYLARPLCLADVVLRELRCWRQGGSLAEIRIAVQYAATREGSGLPEPTDDDIIRAIVTLEERGDVTRVPMPTASTTCSPTGTDGAEMVVTMVVRIPEADGARACLAGARALAAKMIRTGDDGPRDDQWCIGACRVTVERADAVAPGSASPSPTTGLWRSRGINGGKYLVQRRDGTVPEWPYFVLGAKDPCAPDALRSLALAAAVHGLDRQYVLDVGRLADAFDAYRQQHGVGDPDALPYRKDDPATIAKMNGETPVAPSIATITTAELRAELASRLAGPDADDARIRLPGGGTEDTHVGRFHGLFNVDDEGNPLALFADKGDAERYLTQRQTTDPDGPRQDDYLSRDWCVLRTDALLSVLNGPDPGPFGPLDERDYPPFTLRTRADVSGAS